MNSIENKNNFGFEDTNNREKLNSFIEEGLDFIKQGDNQNAILYFRNQEMAARFGFNFVIKWRSILEIPSQFPRYEGLQRLLLSCNANCLFIPQEILERQSGYSDKGLMIIGDIFDANLYDGYFQNSGQSKVIQQQQIQHNIALNYAEVWLSALHYLTQRVEDREVFVSRSLHEYRVPVAHIWSCRHSLLLNRGERSIK